MPVLRIPKARSAAMRRLAVLALGHDPRLDTRLLLLYALTMGALGGAAEAGYLTIRHVATRELGIAYFPEVMWMAPIAGALAFVAVALPIALVARLARTGIDVHRATLVFFFLAVFGVMQSRGFPFHPLAKVVLSLGIAIVIARLAVRRAAVVARAIPAAGLAVGVTLVLLVVLGTATLPGFTERRRLARLPEARAGSPNVLLIILDTVRAANLSLYGYERNTTPHLAAWAEAGVVYDRAVSTAPWTLPSHASMFTGEYNFAARTAFRRPLDDRHPVLAEVLGAHGYATAAFVANLYLATRATGLARGFALYDDLPFTPGMFAHSYWILRGFSRRIAALPGRQYWAESKSAEQVTNAFLRWLERRPERPFFAFLNYFDAHDPYVPPPPYRTMYGPAPDHELSKNIDHTPARLGPWINAYDGAITYIDAQLRRLFDVLDDAGLRDNTIVIVTADHGEMFGEHGLIKHANGGAFIPVLHVPLAIVFPKTVPDGIRIATPVSLRDLPATVLDLAGFGDGAQTPGQSLAGLWSGDALVTPSPVLSEVDLDPRVILSPEHVKSLVVGSFHYIRSPDGAEQLYDLATDPGEELNLTPETGAAPTLARMRATVDSLFGSPRPSNVVACGIVTAEGAHAC